MRTYVDHARTLEILKQDSGLLDKPRGDWNVFEPKEGDYANAAGQDYIFQGGEWVETDPEPEEEQTPEWEKTAAEEETTTADSEETTADTKESEDKD